MLLLTEKHFRDSEKFGPFECGFSPWQNSRQSFSIQFFLVRIIFLIFDVEVILLFPYFTNLINSVNLISILIFVIFLVVLMGGFIIEWGLNQLNWYN